MRPSLQNFVLLVLLSSTCTILGLWVYKHRAELDVASSETSGTGQNKGSASQEQLPKMLRKQIKHLLNTPVAITLDQNALHRNQEFSCGETHVVELKSYKELKGIKHLKEVLPESDLFLSSQHGRMFKTCAVVGNSGSLLETQYGEEIDAHDVVIRFNHGITEGYRQFVGGRTTFRIYNGPVSEPKEPGEITLSTVRDKSIRKWMGDVKEYPKRNDTAYVFDPEFLCYSWQWVRNQGHKPSSGLVGMIFALKICNKVNAYGFQAKNYFSSSSRPHYYDWERPQRGREKVHPFQREMVLYKQLETMGFLKFRHSEKGDTRRRLRH